MVDTQHMIKIDRGQKTPDIYDFSGLALAQVGRRVFYDALLHSSLLGEIIS